MIFIMRIVYKLAHSRAVEHPILCIYIFIIYIVVYSTIDFFAFFCKLYSFIIFYYSIVMFVM